MMISDCEQLAADISKCFRDVSGPPRITLSVARGIDDHRYDELAKLARKQCHHRHWKNVSSEEISYYHDTWNFLDHEAFRFYLPAFMCDYLNSCVRAKALLPDPRWVSRLSQPNAEIIDCFTREQRKCFQDFLELILRSKGNPLDYDFFQTNVVQPWLEILKHRNFEQSQ